MLRALLLSLCLCTPAHAQDWIGAALAEWGYRASTGAAAGYVPDTACAECHSDKAESFAHVGMAKSFYRPSAQKVIEDFDRPAFFHAPSGRYYKMSRDGDAYLFRRWRQASDGTQVDVFETAVDWIMGSGHHSRVYMFQTENGALMQLPLAWYTQGKEWQMAPGYEFADHPGITRTVPQRCMACHNAFPEVPVGHDRIGMPDVFPADLPEGIGCQRCHGPGARHSAMAIAGTQPLPDIRAAIVNPGGLPQSDLYSICYGCHMQPSVAVNAPLRPGRSVYSFRPGEPVDDYKTFIDITDNDLQRGDRFDINHHPYRLEQSACFTQSAGRPEGQLGCLSCHDPHVKIRPEDRAAHYRQACLTCHELDASGQPETAQADTVHPRITDSDDCTLCHMPKRRTQDVIHVTMTDHLITRRPGDAETRLAPMDKRPPKVTEVFPLRPNQLPPTEELVQTLRALLSHGGRPPDWATEQLASALDAKGITYSGPWIELANSFAAQGRPAEAHRAASRALAADPANPGAQSAIAVADLRMGNTEAAIARLKAASRLWPGNVTLAHNLAVALRQSGRLPEALAQARRVTALHRAHWPSQRLVGDVLAQTGDTSGAIDAYLETLRIHPDAPRTRGPLSDLLRKAGRQAEAALHASPNSLENADN